VVPAAETPPRLPVGTQVVLRHAVTSSNGGAVQKGATGRVVRDAGSGYEVLLPDGTEFTAGREDLALRRAYQHDLAVATLGTADGHALVTGHTVLATVVGSRAFGLDTDTSDTDVRGTYLAPTSTFWGLVPPPAHVEGPEPERFSWELGRFCELALKANPNLLEVLWSPLRIVTTPVGEELLELRAAFLSQLAYQTYNGYVLSQFVKIEADLRRRGAPKWKHVMHLVRLLLSARTLLATGEPLVDVGPHRDRLLAVRAGQVPWPEVEDWRRALHAEIEEVLLTTTLPPVPDAARVDAWLRDVRGRSARESLEGR
jgi:uncharacterized protein